MSNIYTCEHDDCIVVHSSPGRCPLCEKEQEFDSLESDNDELRSAINRLEDER